VGHTKPCIMFTIMCASRDPGDTIFRTIAGNFSIFALARPLLSSWQNLTHKPEKMLTLAAGPILISRHSALGRYARVRKENYRCANLFKFFLHW
jgi:hypothetical protein